MKHLILTILLGISFFKLVGRTYTPSASANTNGAATYCLGETPNPVTFTYATCFAGSGASDGALLTVNWYKNAVNTTSGGTLVSSSGVVTGTSDSSLVSFLPATTDTGVAFYYCVITWDTTSSCNSIGNLTSGTIRVAVFPAPSAIVGTSNVCMGYTITLSDSISGGVWSASLGTGRVGIDSVGNVLGMASGTATVTYAIGSCAVTHTMNIGLDPAVITGTSVICPGTVSTLRSSTTGGTWSTSDASVASVNTSGAVLAISPGSVTITYTSGFCFVQRPMVITRTLLPITGSATVCRGATTTLSNPITGGTWSRTNGTGSISINTSGVVSGAALGTATVTYTIGSCFITTPMTVVTPPAAIGGASSVCEGSATTYTNTVAGGTWTVNDPAVATINATTGVLLGLTAGTAVVTYSNSACYTVRTVSIVAMPSAIAGSASLCIGGAVTLTNTVTGGTWSRTNGTGAVAITSSGVVTASRVGTATISYTTGGLCRATMAMRVNVTPVAISGSASVCTGSTTTLTNAVSGGTWTTSNAAIASISATTGVAYGIVVGSANITYTTGTCFVVHSLSVLASPAAITGPSNVCNGAAVTLANSTTGGTWSRVNGTGTGTIGSTTAIFRGITAGTVTVSYTVGSCRATRTMNVLANPGAITGATPVCTGNSIILSNAALAGTWTSASAGVASVSATGGRVTGVTAGTTTISYANGCGSPATVSVTVNSTPAAITGTSALCAGTSTTLASASAGGSWTSSNASIASVSATGTFAALAAGSATITYTTGACFTTAGVNVLTLPAAGTITGADSVCAGISTIFTATIPGGTWSTSDASIASISTMGAVTGLTSGVATITYSFTNICGTVFTTATIFVNAVPPTPPSILGSATVCAGIPDTLSDAVAGGVWSSSDVTIASVSASGIATGLSAGTATISYGIANSCGAVYAVLPFSVRVTPAPITGSSYVCMGYNDTLAEAVGGGNWTSALGTGRISVNSAGIVLGMAVGTATVYYTIGSCSVSMDLTVGPVPNVITGTNQLCTGAAVTFANSTRGGAWTTSDGTIATISSTGRVNALSAGNANITYTSGFCYVLRPVTVYPVLGPITGPSSVCRGGTVNLSNTVAGGRWSRTNLSGAISLSSAGVVTGTTVGAVTVTYAIATCSVSTSMNVVNAPAAITGANNICAGTTTTFANTVSGGAWTTSNGSIASVNTAGLVFGIGAGTATITYSTGSCYAVRNIIVNTMPVGITGSSAVCASGTTTLSDATSGGTWSRTNGTGTINISSGGVVSGLTVGNAVVSYTIGACRATLPISIISSPSAITGATAVCENANITLANSVTGGTWSTASAAVASVHPSTGVVTGVGAGSVVISYAAGSCFVTRSITVNRAPAAIGSPATVCSGSMVTLTNAVTGGTWSRTNGTGTGSIVSSTGVFTGILVGTVTVSYTIGSCRATQNINVTSTAGAITGGSSVCTGASVTLSSASFGGSWTSSNTTVATVNSTTGVVSGISAGSVTISYNTGCGTPASSSLTVNAAPAITLGAIPVVAAGATTVLVPFTSAGLPTSYAISWNAAAAAAGFTNVTSASLTSTPLSVPVSARATTGSYSGSLTVSNGTCMSAATSFSVPLNTGKRIQTYAGISSNGYTGDNGAAVLGKISNPYDVATDRKGNVFIADYGNGVVRKVAPTGVITTVAGSGLYGYSGDGGQATAARLSNPISVAVDAYDNLYISDYNNHVIRKVSSNGIISTVAGNAGHGYAGDGGAATAATLNYPVGLKIDNSGNLLICDYINAAIRKVNSSGIITTIAGTGTNGYSGDGGPATAARLGFPRDFALDAAGNIYIADYDNNVIRQINTTGTITTIAGTGAIGYTGDGGPATAATFSTPYGIATDANGNIFVSEKYNHTIRKITTSGMISTYAGTGTAGNSGDGGDASNAKLYQPMGLAVDSNNNVFVCDNANFIVRIIGEYNRTPFFPAANPTISVCRNAPATTIDSIMKGTDFDTTQTINWSLVIAPAHGTFAGSSTQTSTGRSLSVTGFSYRPDSGYVGADSLVVRIADGPTFTDNKVYINVIGDPAPGTITGAGLVCITSVIHVVDTIALGTWRSSAPAIATVDRSGYVTGVSAGDAAVTFTVTTACGSSNTSATVHVVDYPSASASASTPCTGHSTNVITTASAGSTVRYSINGGAAIDTVVASGSLTITTPALSSIYTYRLINVHNSSCTTNIDRVTTINPIAMVWQGGTSGHETDWNTSRNWSCGTIPSVTDDISVPGSISYYPSLAVSDSAFGNHLSIASSASVLLNSNATLYIKGNITNNNQIKGTGKLVLNGSSSQSISGVGKISNLELSNTSGATISSSSRVTLDGTLTLTAGTLTTRDSLVLASDSNSTGRVAPIASGASISGNVKVMQYIPGGYRRYRFWSHPFSNYTALSQIQNYIDVTGVGGSSNGFTTTATNDPSAYYYNPTIGNSAASYDPGWRAFTNANGAADSNRIHQYQGVRIFMRGKKGEGLGFATYTPSAATIGQWGQLNQGRQLVRLQKGTSSGQDYNMIGNPYASPVDIGTVLFNAKAAGNILGSFYVWNPYMGSGGQFQAITISSVSATPYYLQANCAFQVRAVHNNDTLVFNESNKSNNVTTPLLRASSEYVALTVYDENYHPYDMLNIRFDGSSVANEDNIDDAGKPMGPDFNFYSISADNHKLAIDVRPYETEKVIPLGVTSNFAQDFIIRAENIAVPEGKTMFLHDKLLGTYSELVQGGEYRFTITKEENTQGDNRFEIAMKPATAATETAADLDVTMTPNPANEDVKLTFHAATLGDVQVRVTDMNGVAVYSQNAGAVQSGTIQVPLNNFAAGIYLVEFQSGENKVVRRLVKE